MQGLRAVTTVSAQSLSKRFLNMVISATEFTGMFYMEFY